MQEPLVCGSQFKARIPAFVRFEGGKEPFPKTQFYSESGNGRYHPSGKPIEASIGFKNQACLPVKPEGR